MVRLPAGAVTLKAVTFFLPLRYSIASVAFSERVSFSESAAPDLIFALATLAVSTGATVSAGGGGVWPPPPVPPPPVPPPPVPPPPPPPPWGVGSGSTGAAVTTALSGV